MKQKSEIEIWIRVKNESGESFILYKPQEAHIEKDYSNEFMEKITISWFESLKQVFDKSVFDKRCKNSQSIMKNLIKKYGVKE